MKRRGSILMEFVMVAPLVLLLVSFVLQFAHIWTARQITAYAAYCATRAIMAVPPEEQEDAAKKAAELACSWMSLVGRKGGDGDDGGNVSIPGWGVIPGSDSAEVRVANTAVVENGASRPVASVTVQFKFPLVLPLAGRMMSWWVNKPDEKLDSLDYGHHSMTGESTKGWAGQEVVMDEHGNAEERGEAHDMSRQTDGKYPFIVLTETCVLPMPYSTARFPACGYRNGDAASTKAVSDLLRGGAK